MDLAAPTEVGTGLDFINLAIDDEYGLKSLPFRPHTVLDIGANFGLFSLLAAHYCPGSQIHAYEPNERIFPKAAENLGLINATAFQAGVGSICGLAELHDVGDSRYAQTVLTKQGNVQIVALRTAIERMGNEVDLLKLDCEGAEWDIFQDAKAFEKVRLIRMEYHLTGGRCLEDLTGHAEHLGFRIDRLIPNQGFGIAWLSKQT